MGIMLFLLSAPRADHGAGNCPKWFQVSRQMALYSTRDRACVDALIAQGQEELIKRQRFFTAVA